MAEMISLIVMSYLFKIKRTWINNVAIGMGVKIATWVVFFYFKDKSDFGLN